MSVAVGPQNLAEVIDGMGKKPRRGALAAELASGLLGQLTALAPGRRAVEVSRASAR